MASKHHEPGVVGPHQGAADRTDLVGGVVRRTSRFVDATGDDDRKAIAQIFTPPPIARFMAERVGAIGEEFTFVDAGAGVGMLAAALCERIARLGTRCNVRAELYETDLAVMSPLRETMNDCGEALRRCGHRLSYTIFVDDFVLRRTESRTLVDDGCTGYADAVIMNPPYFKLTKNSPQARAFTEIVHGQPNVYALFMAAAVELLRPGGDLVAITPRSFCNGLYFRDFRRWLLARMSLRQVHLFESRRAAFKDAAVLQESVITVATKQTRQSPTVVVSCSHGAEFAGAEASAHAAAYIIDDSCGDRVIRLPTSALDPGVINAVESWSATFAERGLRISTGPVVSFRATEFLLASGDHPEAVPLLSMHNVRPFATNWPVFKGSKPIAFRACAAASSLLLPAQNYVLVRRFSAKEEHRRLTAAAYLPSAIERRKPIALENHLNYITHCRRELSEAETHGLTALFNSAILDRYFRVLSGNTQVNATEIRSMPFPDLGLIARIGLRTSVRDAGDRAAIDSAVLDELGIDASMLHKKPELAA